MVFHLEVFKHIRINGKTAPAQQHETSGSEVEVANAEVGREVQALFPVTSAATDNPGDIEPLEDQAGSNQSALTR